MNSTIFLPFPGPLYAARFLDRPNRFLIRCAIVKQGAKERPGREREKEKEKENGSPCDAQVGKAKAGDVVEAHLADPGRLKELLVPGRTVWIRYANKAGRKTRWSTVLCERPAADGLVSLDSALPNRLIALALQEKALDEFSNYQFVKAEFKKGSTRWDFLLEGKRGVKLLLEVKSVTLVENGTGLFPDAVTGRGARHVQELTGYTRQKGWQGAILFVVQRDDVQVVKPAADRDPVFAERLKEAAEAGVLIFARSCAISLEGIKLGAAVPVKV